MERAVVFGSFVVDLMSRAGHLPVPGETVKGTMFQMGPGGKGFNQGIGARRAGADITMVTKIGRDSFGEVALNMLKQEGISADYIFVSEDTPTGAALIMVDETTSQNQIMVTLGACGTFNGSDIQKVSTLLDGAGFLLTQLETNVDAVEKLVDIAVEKGVRVILNPAPVQPIKDEMYRKIDLITPNEVEASILTGVEVNSYDSALQAAEVFLSRGSKASSSPLAKWGRWRQRKRNTGFFRMDGSRSLTPPAQGMPSTGGFSPRCVRARISLQPAHSQQPWAI